MTIRNLNFFFQPKRVALIGASERPGSIGLHVAENLLRAGFLGDIGFVNPKRSSVLGRPCYSSSGSLPFVPELGLVATPPHAVPGVIAELGRKGCRAAVVITAGVTGNIAQQCARRRGPIFCASSGRIASGFRSPT